MSRIDLSWISTSNRMIRVNPSTSRNLTSLDTPNSTITNTVNNQYNATHKAPTLISDSNHSLILQADGQPTDTINKKIDSIEKEKAESLTDGSNHSDASFLLQSDVDMIMSISGYRLVKKGALSSFQDEAGNSPPPELAIRLFEFSGSIELARMGGALNGNATKAEIDRIFKNYSSNFNPFPKEWAENASRYFRK